MCHRTLPTLALGLLLGTACVAQPSAQQVIDQAHQTYSEMMAAVDSYLITMDMFGMEHQMYFERIEGGGELDFQPFVRVQPHNEWVTAEDEIPGGASIPTEEVFERLRDQARLIGEESIGGRRAYALAVDNPAAVFPADHFPGDQDFEFDSMTLYVATDDYAMVGFDGEGTGRRDGQAVTITMEMRSSDYRTVGPMTYPFVTEMRMGGFAEAMSDQERRQLEEARRQMEQMPAEQREMMERMMGDQMQQLEAMMSGDGMNMEMRVTDLQVNVPRPQ